MAKYDYYGGDLKNPSVRDPIKQQGRGSIKQTNDGKWESENGNVFDTMDEAADDNGPSDLPTQI